MSAPHFAGDTSIGEMVLSTTREWAVERTQNNGTDTIELTISIRRVGTTVTLDSGVYTLNATVDGP